MTLIYIDTNVFLDFYQSATDRMSIFQELLARAENIFVPEQTVREFRRNRAARLNQLADQLEKSASINIFTTAIVREMQAFKEWEQARDAAKRQMKVIAAQLRTWARDEESDPVYREVEKLWVNGMTVSTPDDALSKAQERKLVGDPPTSPDKHTLGDEIIWETLLACCSDDLIIVSRDRTFLDNESILRREFDVRGGRRLISVTENLSDALKLVGKPSEKIKDAEQGELGIEALKRQTLETICPRCRAELEEGDYEADPRGFFWWLKCQKCGFVGVPG